MPRQLPPGKEPGPWVYIGAREMGGDRVQLTIHSPDARGLTGVVEGDREYCRALVRALRCGADDFEIRTLVYRADTDVSGGDAAHGG